MGSGTAPFIQVLRNGSAMSTPGSGLLFYLGVVYVQASDGLWYHYDPIVRDFVSGGTGDPEGASPTSVAVVPGAFGFGMDTRAAYGLAGTDPVILRVQNRNDSGAGSLRAAMEDPRPRFIIFETSGTITLDSDITVVNPYMTVAGQTAPSPGITIRGSLSATTSAGGIWIWTHDVLIQHIRIRTGDGGPVTEPTAAHDALQVYGAGVGIQSVYNIVIDHCSISWAGGKNFQFQSIAENGGATMWRCISSEGLYHARNVVREPGPYSLGLLLTNKYVGVQANFAAIGNLLAHNSDRNPEVQGGRVNFINNVVYDWGKDIDGYTWASLIYGASAGTLPSYVNLIGNKYIGGPAAGTPYTPLYAIGTYGLEAPSVVYLSDNLVDNGGQSVPIIPYYPGNNGYNAVVGTPAVPTSGIVAQAASGIEAAVLDWVGARPSDRDAVDTRIIDEVSGRTGIIPTSQDQVGGWPTLAVNVVPLITPANPHAKTSSGYTNLEIWSHGYSAAVGA
jgi:hypothetical protein